MCSNTLKYYSPVVSFKDFSKSHDFMVQRQYIHTYIKPGTHGREVLLTFSECPRHVDVSSIFIFVKQSRIGDDVLAYV